MGCGQGGAYRGRFIPRGATPCVTSTLVTAVRRISIGMYNIHKGRGIV